MDEWPVAYPCRRGPWTVTDGTRWGIVDPAKGQPGRLTDDLSQPTLPAEELGQPLVVDPADDPVLIGLNAALEQGRLVSYRHHRRAVVRTPFGYIKVTAPKKLHATVDRHRLAAKLGVRGPIVQAWHPDGRIELDAVPGQSLHGLIGSGSMTPAQITADQITSVAAAMTDLHQHRPVDLAAYDTGPGWIETTARAAPDLAKELRHTSDRLPPMPVGDHLVHGDLHDKNILISPRPQDAPHYLPHSAGLIDFDGLALGDPAIDVGNLTAHVALRALQGRIGHLQASLLRNRLLASYSTFRTVDSATVRIVERHTWLRLAGLYYFRRFSHHLVPSLISLAASDDLKSS